MVDDFTLMFFNVVERRPGGQLLGNLIHNKEEVSQENSVVSIRSKIEIDSPVLLVNSSHCHNRGTRYWLTLDG